MLFVSSVIEFFQIYNLLLGDVITGFRVQNVTLANSGQNKSERALYAY